MKRYILSLLALLVVSCGGPSSDEGQKSEIEFKDAVIPKPVFKAEGGSTSITFIAGKDWYLTVSETRSVSWCNVAPVSGQAGQAQFTIKTEANNHVEERKAEIRIMSGNDEVVLMVRQEGGDPSNPIDNMPNEEW